jgi:membrane-associated phospholipid phosphatase
MPPLGMTNQITFTIHEFAPGMFFSGHVANSLLVYLMMPVRKTWMLCMSMIIATLLVISHAHYTVDIIGGYAIGWSLYCFCEKYLKHIFLGRI